MGLLNREGGIDGEFRMRDGVMRNLDGEGSVCRIVLGRGPTEGVEGSRGLWFGAGVMNFRIFVSNFVLLFAFILNNFDLEYGLNWDTDSLISLQTIPTIRPTSTNLHRTYQSKSSAIFPSTDYCLLLECLHRQTRDTSGEGFNSREQQNPQ